MAKEVDTKFLWYYLAKRIINNAEWDEALQQFYVRLENGYMSITADEYKYLKKVAQWDDDK